jgi:hypothetical protein
MDELASDTPRRYEWWLHAWNKMRIDEGRQVVESAQKKARLRVDFLRPEKLSFSQTDQFDPPPERGPTKNQWHVTASTEPVKETRFVVVMTAYEEGETKAIPRIELKEDELVLSRGQDRFEVSLSPGEAVWRDEGGKVRQCFRVGKLGGH